MASRSASTLALPPHAYTADKGAFWKGVQSLERFPPTYPSADEVFEEYMANPSMSPSRHVSTLSKSKGMLELHYDTMRKKQQNFARMGNVRNGPTMDRAYTAAMGYSGVIPGKHSGNICGCSFQAGSQLAFEQRGKFLDPPNSGLTFTMTKSTSLPSLTRTA